MVYELLPIESYGIADAPGRHLAIGGIDLPVWSDRVAVYVRRDSSDLAIVEVLLARHDGPAEDELDYLNFEAERYPLGPKEYWRSRMVGKYTYGSDSHRMTEEDFEEFWAEDQ